VYPKLLSPGDPSPRRCECNPTDRVNGATASRLLAVSMHVAGENASSGVPMPNLPWADAALPFYHRATNSRLGSRWLPPTIWS
jgi:hypothetical protein